ncbi:hypothetical protein K469DRAFT_335916 [Zopfia rhizophila CBS 207.26]|uniref:HORMA domain-containing protein n=1 Tax=Zopfia rhizophila CBS 207.26 TaxID=1314779 RepID=A0A6A6DHB5_9PEZI|nr:hypothetical protein K469DRAFT_335916 [Zopfia rhizophila CBS 207.26]
MGHVTTPSTSMDGSTHLHDGPKCQMHSFSTWLSSLTLTSLGSHINEAHCPVSTFSMARTQTTKPKVAAASTAQTEQETATSTDQAISVTQSTEVVQTLLHGSISCLSYLRSLFDEKCFDDQFYETSNAHWAYDDYAAGLSQPKQTKQTGTRMKVLRRGRSSNVDRLLDWLEKGAFDALRRNVLRALQLNIFEDPDKPSNVIELYTFTFHYTDSPKEPRELTGIEMAGPRGYEVTIKNAKYAMQMFIRRLIALCGTLPDLPQRRYLKMHLFYTDDCHKEYHPPGFDASVGNSIFFPNTDCKKMTSSCGEMNAGFHNVCLRVSHLTLSHAANVDCEDSIVDTALPNDLAYTTPANREDDIALDVTEAPSRATQGENEEATPSQSTNSHDMEGLKLLNGPHQTQGSLLGRNVLDEQSPSVLSSVPTTTSPDVDLDMIPERPPLEIQQPQQLGYTSTPRRASRPMEDTVTPAVAEGLDVPMGTGETTGSSFEPEDLRIKERLKQMLKPSGQDHDMEDTQQQSGPLQQPGKQSDISEQMSILQLSQAKIQELETRRSNILPPRKHGLNVRRRSGSASADLGGECDVINCQCGWNEEEDDMINCSFCDTWQHLHCYGFRGSEDARIPAVHACYQCLLHSREDALLRELRDLALLRRGVHILETKGFSNDKEFSNVLHCDLQTASRLASHLRKEGYLVPSLVSKKSFAGKPRFSLSRADTVVDRMIKQYFDPLSKIAHHFELPKTKASFLPSMMTQAPSSMEDGAGISQPGSQGGRYPLRQRYLGSLQQAMVGSAADMLMTSPTPTRKRSRSAEDTTDAITPTPKRRLRSSVAMGIINIGEFPTPSPMRRGSGNLYG